MRPVRKSSEGPEVVHPILSDKYAISERLERARVGRWTQYQKQVDPYQVETRNFPLSPPLPPSPMPSLPSNIVPDRVEKPRPRQKTFGLITITILVSVAFLVGGGVGGGIGGSLVAKEKSKSRITTSTTVVMPTSTVLAPPVTTTVLQDAAFCPLIHNTPYNSTSTNPPKKFLQICNNNFLPQEGQKIDIKNATLSTLQACLDFCAQTDGCVAASWVMFSATSPIQNSVCLLKNGLGEQTKTSGIGQVASGYLQPLPG